MAAIAQVITGKNLFSQTPTLSATVNGIMSYFFNGEKKNVILGKLWCRRNKANWECV